MYHFDNRVGKVFFYKEVIHLFQRFSTFAQITHNIFLGILFRASLSEHENQFYNITFLGE